MLRENLEGFYFTEEEGIVKICYNHKKWEPVWKGKKFVGYKRKNEHE